MSALLYVGQAVADELWDGVRENLHRYVEDGFADLVAAGDWSIPLRRDFDPEPLTKLTPDAGVEAELRNSELVWKALGATLTPSLAREGRIWIRLSHVECLDFARQRWLSKGSEDTLEASVKAHFFANTRTAARDDHAIARLWWNGWIARQISPEQPESALNLILSSADIRSNLIERPWIFARPPLAAAILRVMQAEEWLLQGELNFREFIKAANLLGGGVAFEIMEKKEIESFLRRCLAKAQAVVAVRTRIRAHAGATGATTG
jgi:hypothetical protein